MCITKLQKTVLKRLYTLYDFNYMTIWKSQKQGDGKQICGSQGLGRRRVEKAEHWKFLGQ